MEQKEWSTVHRIFSRAIDLPPHERGDYVRIATASAPHMSAAVLALLQADSDAGDYLEQPLVSPAELESMHRGLTGALLPGVLLAGRFEVLRELGAGGMGRVYLALDTEFHTMIAIKTIREDLLASPEALRRFRHEAQLARRLSHPNICRIHDLERAIMPGSRTGAELFFITMEFLDGCSLADEISQHGALPLHEVTSIALQTAAALDAAHRAGVTHGDLKPANILLCRKQAELRVVVTDFGLARAHVVQTGSKGESVDGQISSTLAVGPAGTLAYMAPEQIAGGSPATATDIYAFGLVLYELLTGCRAFAETDPLRGIAERLTAAPPSPRRQRPDVPDNWCMAVEECLRTTPATRPATASAALALATRAGAARRQRFSNRLRAFSQRRSLLFTLAALAVVLAVSLFLVFFRFNKTEAPRPVESGARIYMPPVRNLSGNPTLNDVTAMMHAALAQSPHVALLSDAAAADTLQRMMKPADAAIDETTARDIALRTESARVVFATVRQLQGRLQLSVEVQQPDTPGRARSRVEHSWSCCTDSKSGSASAMPDTSSYAVTRMSEEKRKELALRQAQAKVPGDLLHIVRDAAEWVRNNLGEPAESVRDLNDPVEDITTMSWLALTEFSEAERLARAGRQADAVTILQQAVTHDPGFALAYGRMGDLQFYLKRAGEGIQSYQHALAAGSDRRLSRRERDRLRGLYDIDTGDYSSAETTFRDSVIHYDHDYLGRFYLAFSLFKLGRGAEAMEQMSHAIALDPVRPSGPFALGSFAFVAGDRQTALAQVKALRKIGGQAEALWLQAEDAWLQGNTAMALAQLQQVRTVTESPFAALATMQLTRLQMETGGPERARETALEGIATAERRGNADVAATHRMDVAAVDCAQGELEECLREMHASLQDDSSPRNIRNAGDILRNALATTTAAQRSQIAAVLRAMHATMPAPVYGTAAELVQRELEGDIALAEGRVEDAKKSFQAASVLDAPGEAEYRRGRALVVIGDLQGSTIRAVSRDAVPTTKLRAFLWYQCDYFPPQSGKTGLRSPTYR